ncbi:hypothetical protein At1D1460_46640 [Agrobacterium tumefaciens]|nr:hypothetical protein At1D1460_46640 [Agrobacterium tumefaciens]
MAIDRNNNIVILLLRSIAINFHHLFNSFSNQIPSGSTL